MTSQKIAQDIETPDYWVTIGKWHSDVTGISYEVGCRRKSDGKFWLVASYLRTQKEAEAIAEKYSKDPEQYLRFHTSFEKGESCK